MNILSRVTWKAMWKNRTRTIVTVVGVILSAAMFMAITSVAASSLDYLRRYSIANTGDYHCCFEDLTDRELEQLSQLPEVSEVGTVKNLGHCLLEPPDGLTVRYLLAACNDTYFRNMPLKVTGGRLPQNSNELLLDGNNLDTLQKAGYPVEIGATVTLPVTVEAGGERRETEKTYTVVGVGELNTGPMHIGPEMTFIAWLYTYDDGGQGEVISTNAYVKTDPVRAILPLYNAKEYGRGWTLQTELLLYYGVMDGPANSLTLMGLIVGALCAIVLLGSVSLIYNAFSISVTERTKEFGLLCSVGATKKQLRRSLLFEAAVVSGLGIPLGLLAGYGGAVALMGRYRWELEKIFATYGNTPQVSLRVLFSWQAMAIAAAIALVTVLLSAWIPARRATRISPLEAIRQTEDYQVEKKLPRSRRSRLFGFPGTLAKRYYAVSRKKYRAAVVSLSVSLALFVATMSISQLFLDVTVLRENRGSFDIRVDGRGHPEDLAQVRQQAFVEESALVYSEDNKAPVLDRQMYSQAMLDNWDKLYYEVNVLGLGAFVDGITTASVQYLEDGAFRALLKENGIRDEAPYFSEGKALALNVSGFADWGTGDKEERFTFRDMRVLSPEVTELILAPNYYIPAIDPFQNTPIDGFFTYEKNTAGELLMKWRNLDTGEIVYHLARQEERDGGSGIAYYHYDPETGKAGHEAFYFWEGEKTETVSVGGAASGVPCGIVTPTLDWLVLVKPMSALPEAEQQAQLFIRVNDYRAAIEYLDGNELYYMSYIAEEMNVRTVVAAIQSFVSGFVSVISLICAANIFNTASTNVSLRRRDLGMLQSLGMQKGQMLAMLVRECMGIGLRSLCWGLGVGLLLHGAFCLVTRSNAYIPFQPPWAYMGIATLAVVLLVSTATAYAFLKMKKDSPIAAIRQENL